MKVKEIHDLSVTLKPGMPTWKSSPEVKIEYSPGVEKEGHLIESYSSLTHTGTHVDAPAHYVARATTVDQIDLETLVGIGYCIRPDLDGTDITYNSLEKIWEKKYEKNILLLHTGWDKKRGFTKEFQNDFPGLSYDAIDFFKQHPVKMIGLDTLGIEPFNHTDFRVHKELLSLGIPFIEDMAGLDKLEEGKDYFIAALPLKIGGGSGSMARVIAMELEED